MNLSESKPDGFRAGFTIAFSAEETAQLSDQAQHLVKLGFRRLFGLSKQIRAANLVDIEEQFGVQIRAGAAHAHQICDPPSHDQEQRQSAFEPLDRAQLQGLDTATVLQHIEQDLDFPARPIPVDEFGGLRQRRRFAVSQQAPFDRLDAGGRVELARHQARGGDTLAFASGQLDTPQPHMLAYLAGLHTVTRTHREGDLADRLAFARCVPQLGSFGKGTIMGRANQPIGLRAQLLRAHHQRNHVRLAISDVHQPRIQQAMMGPCGVQLDRAALRMVARTGMCNIPVEVATACIREADVVTGELVLSAKRVWYYSECDEAAFFEWLDKLPCVKRYEGELDVLNIYVDEAKVDESALRELLALFRRIRPRIPVVASVLDFAETSVPLGRWSAVLPIGGGAREGMV